MGNSGTKRNDPWEWTPARERAAQALADGKSYKQIEAEKIAGHTALVKWTKRPEFLERVDELHEEIIADARRYLRRNALKAAQKLVHIMEGAASPYASIRLQAAKDVLDRVGLKALEQDDRTTDITITITDARERLAHRLFEATAEGDTYSVVTEPQ